MNNKVKVNRLTLLRNSVKCNGLRVLRRCDTVENSCYEACQVIIFLHCVLSFSFLFLFISPPKLVIFFALHNFLTASSSSWLYPSVASCNNYRILRNNPARGWYEFYFPVHVQAKSHTSMLDSTRVRHQLETSPACAREDKRRVPKAALKILFIERPNLRHLARPRG